MIAEIRTDWTRGEIAARGRRALHDASARAPRSADHAKLTDADDWQ